MTPDEARWLHDRAPESGGRGIGGRLGLPPAPVRRPDDELPGHLARAGQALHPYANQADVIRHSRSAPASAVTRPAFATAGGHRITCAERLEHRPGGLEDFAPHICRIQDGPRTTQRTEVGQADLEGDRTPSLTGPAQAYG